MKGPWLSLIMELGLVLQAIYGDTHTFESILTTFEAQVPSPEHQRYILH